MEALDLQLEKFLISETVGHLTLGLSDKLDADTRQLRQAHAPDFIPVQQRQQGIYGGIASNLALTFFLGVAT